MHKFSGKLIPHRRGWAVSNEVERQSVQVTMWLRAHKSQAWHSF